MPTRCARFITNGSASRRRAATSGTATQYVAGNTGGELVWHAQRLDDAEVTVVGDTAVLTAIARDEFERGGDRGAHAMRLTLTWTRVDGAWLALAGHAGPAL